jgi:hypothetical protein
MPFRIVIIVAAVSLGAAPALAAPMLSIESPSSYTPGGVFQCQILLTGADNLADFTLNLTLSGASGTAGTDYFFQDAAQPALRYVFLGQTTLGFSRSSTGGAAITVGDSLASLTGEVSSVAGVNDRLATLTVKTSAAMTGSLVLSFDTAHLVLDTSAVPPASIPGYSGMVSSLQPMSVVAVPEPATLVLLAGGVCVSYLRHRKRRVRRH